MPGKIVTGMLITQLLSFAGQANRPSINGGLFQPFFNYNSKGGWAFSNRTDYYRKLERRTKQMGGAAQTNLKVVWRESIESEPTPRNTAETGFP